MVTLEINNKYYVTFPSNLPTETIETIEGEFKRGFSGICIDDKNDKAKQCKIKIAILMNHHYMLTQEYNLLLNKIMNFENFQRPLCITKFEQPKQSLLYSIFEIYPKSTCTPSDCLTMEQKRQVTKQIVDALDYLQKKNILMTEFKEGTDFEIRKIEEDIRVQIQLINSTDVTDVLELKGEIVVKKRVQKVIPKVGMALWQIHWPRSVQHIDLENASLDTIAAKLSSPGEPLTSNGYLLVTMLLAMTHASEENKPEWRALKKHPFFWSPSRRIDFIQTFDQYNVKKVDESTDRFTHWRGVDRMYGLVNTNQQHARYNSEENYASLVKLCRNKFQHRYEIEKNENQCISIFGTKHLNAENYSAFFEDPIRFPTFLTWLWHCANRTDDELNEFYPRTNCFISDVRRKLNM